MAKSAGLPLGLLCRRQVRRHGAVTGLVTVAVALTVAASFAVTAMIGALTRGVTGRVAPLELPFDAVALFARESDARAFMQGLSKWEDLAQVDAFPWARPDSPEGNLIVLGAGAPESGPGLPDAIELLSPVLPSWRCASPATVTGMSGVGQGALFTFREAADRARATREVERLVSTYPGTIVVSGESGSALAGSTSRRALATYQVVSAGAALMSAAGIACVLAVAFLGRKRSLGILKVLGGTVPDLQRLFLVEAAFMGGAGIPVGLVLGYGIAAWAYGAASATLPCFLVGSAFGAVALLFGAYLPVRLVRNGTCDQLLNNRPVYAMSNPSCAKCGQCGGF